MQGTYIKNRDKSIFYIFIYRRSVWYGTGEQKRYSKIHKIVGNTQKNLWMLEPKFCKPQLKWKWTKK